MQGSALWNEAKDGIVQTFSVDFSRCFKNVLQCKGTSSYFSALSKTRTG
jgi:hypothetical protein